MSTNAKTRKPKTATTRKATAPKAKPEPRQTKRQLVIDLVRRPGGATLLELIEATGWQPHTARAVISSLRKGMSGKITSRRSRSRPGARTAGRPTTPSTDCARVRKRPLRRRGGRRRSGNPPDKPIHTRYG